MYLIALLVIPKRRQDSPTVAIEISFPMIELSAFPTPLIGVSYSPYKEDPIILEGFELSADLPTVPLP